MTVRDYLSAIRDRHTGGEWCTLCGQRGPCLDYRDAVAALAILDDAHRGDDRYDSERHCRLVPDPEPSA